MKRVRAVQLMPTRRAFLAGSAACAALSGSHVLATEAGAALTERLARSIVASRRGSLSAAVIERVRWQLIDNAATLAFTTRSAVGDPYLQRLYARSTHIGPRVPGTGLKLAWEDAAAALAYLIHYAETDDSDFRAELRASPTVIGPALALAQMLSVTGDDLAAAITVGYSVLGGLAAPFGALQDDGVMSAGFWGPVAAAAVSARLLRLDEAQTANALALGAVSAAGPFQYFYDQSEEKRLILARAAHAGVEAALLAQQGERAALHVLEGRAGLFALADKITGAAPNVSGVADAVARLDGPMYVYPKFFAASSSITPTLEALAPLVSKGLRAGDLDHFALRADGTIRAPVRSKLEHFEAPGSVIGARINYAFMVSHFLVHGAADAATMARARLDDPRVLALAEKARFEPRPGPVSTIVLYFRSGDVRTIDTPDIVPGATTPLAASLRSAKFDAMTRPSLAPAARRRLFASAFNAIDASSAAKWVASFDAALRDATHRHG